MRNRSFSLNSRRKLLFIRFEWSLNSRQRVNDNPNFPPWMVTRRLLVCTRTLYSCYSRSRFGYCMCGDLSENNNRRRRRQRYVIRINIHTPTAHSYAEKCDSNGLATLNVACSRFHFISMLYRPHTPVRLNDWVATSHDSHTNTRAEAILSIRCQTVCSCYSCPFCNGVRFDSKPIVNFPFGSRFSLIVDVQNTRRENRNSRALPESQQHFFCTEI